MNELPEKFGKENIVDGKINWRGWVYYPNDLPDHVKFLLDRMAESTELAPDIRGSDDLEKFDCFKRLALSKGLITNEEWGEIERSKHKAV